MINIDQVIFELSELEWFHVQALHDLHAHRDASPEYWQMAVTMRHRPYQLMAVIDLWLRQR